MKKILLIEDDTTVRENTTELLELANYEVITAANGKIGVEQAKKHRPDIIVCDIMMPELDGYGVLETLSKLKATKFIPFIFLSAKTERKDIRKGMEMGADDYLTKPFEEHELINAIESRLAKIMIQKENQEIRTNIEIEENDLNLKTLDHLKNYFTDHGEEIFYKAGETIYDEGNNSNYVFLVYKGVVKTFRIDEQGKELITALHKGDDFFGFTSFTQSNHYQETSATIEDSTVFRLVKSNLKAVLYQNHAVTLDLIDHLNDNVSEIKDQLLQMAYSSVRKKTANTILRFSEKIKKRPDEIIRISRSDLASVAGIATETFIRTLSGLKKDGLIDIEGRNIRVINLDSLKKVN
jgi:DNA-binding response OmpR family regulator